MRKEQRDYLFLALFSLLVIGVNTIWSALNQRPPWGDEPGHLIKTLEYFYPLKDVDISTFLGILSKPELYPPLAHFITVWFYFWGGNSYQIALLSLQIFVPIFIFSLFLTIRHFWNREIAWAGVILGGTSPFFLEYTRQYLMDMPLLAFTALGFYLLIKTEGFKNRKFSVWLGAIFGLAMLEKWTVLFFLVPAILWTAVPVIWQTLKKTPLLIIGVFISLLCFILLLRVMEQPGFEPQKLFWSLFLPVLVIFIFSLHLAARKLKENDFFSAANLVDSANLGIIICLPWYLYNLIAIIDMEHFLDRTFPINPLFNLNFYLKVWSSSFTLALPLAMTGIIFSLIRRNQAILLTISFLAALLILIFNIQADRYFLPAVFFLVPLAIFWTRPFLPKAAFLITFFLIGLLQLTGWLFLNHSSLGLIRARSSSGYAPICILTSEPPDRANYQTIAQIADDLGNNFKNASIKKFPGFWILIHDEKPQANIQGQQQISFQDTPFYYLYKNRQNQKIDFWRSLHTPGIPSAELKREKLLYPPDYLVVFDELSDNNVNPEKETGYSCALLKIYPQTGNFQIKIYRVLR